VSPQHANDIGWALDYVLPRSGSLYFKAKRICDLASAALLLLLLAPAMLLVILAILLLDGRQPIYGQVRVGYLGRPFRLWKFRTMRQDADREGPFIQRTQSGDDPRVTPLGSLLRRLRIDELPQLWNVVRGDMSLVGPRPEWVQEVEILETAIPTYGLRYLVPPGVTGWAQVYYRATDNPEDGLEKHNYDLYYLKHFSFALDVSILLKTIKRVMMKERRSPAIPFPLSVSESASDSDVPFDVSSIVGRG
jgi:lipopolysaccharide/colanic/teichoic acid biosynthesis glycosyltransferase